MRNPLLDAGFAGEPQTSAGFSRALDFVRQFIRRRCKLIVLTTIPGTALAIASLAIVPTKYDATATMLLDKQRVNFFTNQSVVSELSLETNAAVEGQLEVLKSDAIARAVIKKLNLESDPDFAVSPPRSGFFAALGIGNSTPLTQEKLDNQLVELFAKNRTICRLGPSLAIEVSFQSHSAERAAQVANAIVDTYIADILASQRNAAHDAGGWVRDRLAELRGQVAEAESAVVDFKAKNEIVDAGGKSVIAQQIAEISSELIGARMRLSEVSARLDRAQAAANEYATSSVAQAMTETLNNSLTNKLQEQFLELSNRVAEYSVRFGADHKTTFKLRQRLDEIKRGLVQDMQRLSQSFLSEKAILEERVRDLEASLSKAIAKSRNTEQAQVKLRELESVALSNRTLYEGLLRRHSEAVVQEEQPITGARILSPAFAPSAKNMKKPLVYAVVLAFGSLGLGIGLSLLPDFRDRTFRSRGDIEQRLKSEFIGMIPTWETGLGAAPTDEQSLPRLEWADPDRQVRRSDSALWAFTLSPTSAFAEAIGHVTFAILRNAEKKDVRIIGMTSVLSNEGASTVAAAVVQSLAKSGRSVILVDCDLRRPELTKDLAPHAQAGLQEILLGQASLEDGILRDARTGFAFLPGVTTRLAVRPEELLDTKAFAAILGELRERYDYVIVDLPPMFPMLDVTITDRSIESYVIVVEWGASKIDTVSHALARCPSVQRHMLGLVLNKVDMNRLSLYDHGSAKYYDARRYKNYLLKGPVSVSTDDADSATG
jgi:succinoglycan biosynthesis transport protein ExoP